MPVFEYRALTKSGKTTKGIVDADTAKAARAQLRTNNVHVTDIRALAARKTKGKGDQANKKKKLQLDLTLERGLSTRDLATFTRQFSTLLRSGIQLADALRALVEQCEQRHFEQILRNVKEEITAGNSLAESLAKHPRYFSDLYVNMVRAGEASGNLDQVLEQLAAYIQKQASLKGKVAAAITYPAIMVVVGTFVVIFLMTWVVPRITQVLQDRNQPLPLVTETLVAISGFLVDYWWILIIGAASVFFFTKAVLATDAGRLKFDTGLLRFPIFGQLFAKQAISRFAMTFSTLLKSGLPALDALKIVSLVVNNARLTQVINDIHGRILEGADIATPIKRSKVFPPMVGYMVSVGEQSGQLEEILDRLSESYEEELDFAIQKVTASIEPMIIIALAVVVGFIIAAVLLPLLDFSNV